MIRVNRTSLLPPFNVILDNSSVEGRLYILVLASPALYVGPLNIANLSDSKCAPHEPALSEETVFDFAKFSVDDMFLALPERFVCVVSDCKNMIAPEEMMEMMPITTRSSITVNPLS